MNTHPDLTRISKITDNIFLSGIYPLDVNPDIIRQNNIKCIISCVNQESVAETHVNLLLANPDLTILYVPLHDSTDQNLWVLNNNQTSIVKYSTDIEGFNNLNHLLAKYQNKPMIDIGYHMMDMAIRNNQNVLVHCMAGISRSTSFVMYYFMKKYHTAFDITFQVIKQKRPIVNPNSSFKKQLKKYSIMRDKFTTKDAQLAMQTSD